MRILHISDVHLDRPFVDMGLEDGRARRRELRDVFDRCLETGIDRGVDLVTLGGDLWEDEHVTPDTIRWVRDKLLALGISVVAVAGNHDPLAPGGPYERAAFPESITVLPGGTGLTEHRVGDFSIWGASWVRGSALDPACLSGFRVPDDGRRHILLLHGTCGVYFEGSSHCPFSVDDVRNAGFELCVAGHIHAGSVKDDLVVYPGSPEPLNWTETGRHAVAVIELGPAATSIELVEVASRHYEELVVVCDDADSSAEVERRLVEALGPDRDFSGLCLRAVLKGRVVPGCVPDIDALRSAVLELGATMADVRDQTAVAFDLDRIAAGTGVSSVFVQRMRALEAERPGDPQVSLAVQLGLRALQGEAL
jgi:DNA repair exonuclease SbcCD nuclease subunit